MAPSWKRGAQKPEDEDEDVQLRRSEPQWAAVVAERHRETLRQGALLGREHVKSEETLRPFCRTQQRQQQPYRQRHAEDRSLPDEQHATLFWDSHRARPFNQSASFSLSWDGVRPSPRGGRAGATHRVGHDVSASDFYDAPPPARTRSPNASLREQATIGAAPSSSPPPPPPPSQEHALDLETTCVDLHALSPRGLETMRAAAEREGARGATRWASMAAAAAAAGGAEPGVGSEPAPPLLDMTVDSVLGSGGADSGGGDPLFPAGEELVFWSDGELRDFCAKRELDHGGERAALVERVTEVLRADTSARLSTVTDKLPAGVCVCACVRVCVCARVNEEVAAHSSAHTLGLSSSVVRGRPMRTCCRGCTGLSTRPMFKFEFATDAKLAAKLGLAREPRALPPEAQAVLRALGAAVRHRHRTLYGGEVADVGALFEAMDRDGSGSLSARELREVRRPLRPLWRPS
eukprot:COSAG01_NODE_1691_length_9480_cov_5.430231_15_plen_463_part_00